MTSIPQLIARRLVSFIPVLLVSTFLVFVLVDLAPGDPAFTAYGGVGISEEQRALFYEENGLNDPLPVRYVRFIGDTLQGDLGDTFRSNTPVREVLATGLPITLQLITLALTTAIVLGSTLGVASAIRRGGIVDNGLRSLSLAALAAPNFWLGLLMINLFGVALGWLPTGGYRSFADGPADWLRSLILPAAALAIPLTGVFTRIVRTAVLDELGKDYVRTCFGNGLPPRLVIGRNVLRNALIPPLTVMGIYFGWLLAGAVLVEEVFSLPGIGRALVNGARTSDLFLVRGVALITITLFLVANLVIDVLTTLLTPRLRSASNDR